ncbi:MAG: alpha/beta hydrolase [Granulosicoccus sp.]
MRTMLRRLSASMALMFFGGTVVAQSLPDIREVLENELTCALLQPLMADMPVESVYSQTGTECVVSTPDLTSDSTYFADSSCQTQFAFSPTPLAEHCQEILDPARFGEGGDDIPSAWTLPPGTRLDVGARSLNGLTQPYMQRLTYRRVETAAGVCELEMRVYTKHPGATGQHSLLAFHGGSWSGRGFGFLGLEFTIPHFTERGFVVYAPFYRLLGNDEGSVACRNATITQITDDANAALAWVQQNGQMYGSQREPVVFGQSAGAHLAASLAVYQPESISAAVLYYPPTDFTDFVERVTAGYYDNEQGLDILQRVVGTTAVSAVDTSESPVQENSFPLRVIESDLQIPPVFMLHGMADDLVEPRQSIRMCEAIKRTSLMPTAAEPAPLESLRDVRQCAEESVLHLIREGEHALDFCLQSAVIASDLCRSGSEASRAEVGDSIADSAEFAARYAQNAVTGSSAGVGDDQTDAQAQGSSSGGGAAALWLLALLGCYRCFRASVVATAPVR